jgi:hypothetical protein
MRQYVKKGDRDLPPMGATANNQTDDIYADEKAPGSNDYQDWIKKKIKQTLQASADRVFISVRSESGCIYSFACMIRTAAALPFLG